MTLLSYLSSLGLGQFNIEEDHKMKVTIIRTSRVLTEEQKTEVEKLAPFRVSFIVGNV